MRRFVYMFFDLGIGVDLKIVGSEIVYKFQVGCFFWNLMIGIYLNMDPNAPSPPGSMSLAIADISLSATLSACSNARFIA